MAVWITAIAGFLGSCSSHSDTTDTANRFGFRAPQTTSTLPAGAVKTLTRDLFLHQCFIGTDGFSLTAEVHVVDCAFGHTGEVVASVSLSADPATPYPGDILSRDATETACEAPLGQILPLNPLLQLQPGAVWPDEEKWNAGTATGLCILWDPTGPYLQGVLQQTPAQ